MTERHVRLAALLAVLGFALGVPAPAPLLAHQPLARSGTLPPPDDDESREIAAPEDEREREGERR